MLMISFCWRRDISIGQERRCASQHRFHARRIPWSFHIGRLSIYEDVAPPPRRRIRRASRKAWAGHASYHAFRQRCSFQGRFYCQIICWPISMPGRHRTSMMMYSHREMPRHDDAADACHDDSKKRCHGLFFYALIASPKSPEPASARLPCHDANNMP